MGQMNITLETTFPIAADSPDHLAPHGTKQDNSRNHRFNERLYALLPGPLSILDLGCSGGGFVKDCIDDRHFAVGLEGSDYSKVRERAEWATIPANLFTCDVTKPFRLKLDGVPLRFDVITAWEIMEHISELGLHGLFQNVRAHLRSGALWIVSVSTASSRPDGLELHQTIKPRAWWLEHFLSAGFADCPKLLEHFGGEFIRGPRQNAPDSFNLVLANSLDPAPPRA